MVPESSRGPENEAARLSSLPMQATVLLLKNLKPHFTPRRLYFGRACALAGERPFIYCASTDEPSLLCRPSTKAGPGHHASFLFYFAFFLPVGRG